MNAAFDPHSAFEMFGIPGYWNLVWIIPVIALVATVAACLLGLTGKGPEGPPYVGFDERLDAHMQERDIDPVPHYEPGDPLGVCSPVSEIRQQLSIWQTQILEDSRAAGEAHPGRPCWPECWRLPDGHRRSS